MKVCSICNKEFEPTNNRQKMCSKQCQYVAKNNRRNKHTREELDNMEKTRECPVCGAKFEISNISLKKKYCSDKCSRKSERIFGNKSKTDLEYKDKIRFDGNKYKVLERDNYECQICGNKNKLVIHHKDCSGQTDNPNNELDNLITLCRRCHINIHKVL